MRGLRGILGAGALALATIAGGAAAQETSSVAYTTAALPAFPALGPAATAEAEGTAAGGIAISNRSLARIFTTLTHDMEWGASRRHLVRYEAPVRVGLEGPGMAQYSSFLDRFLAELRRNTGIDIARADGRANLHIRFVGSDFTRLLPTVSCLVAPGDVAWRRFARNPGRHGGRALVRARAIEHMTIFIPVSAPPYLVRNCILEETTQALGTANDLYGLGASIFNDDAAHTWPTALDYLMLRVLYTPEMRTGLGREETERRARLVLDRVNPAGLHARPLLMPAQARMAGWRKRIQKVFSRKTAPDEAVRLAEEALDVAARNAPGSAYHCHSLLTLGRVLARATPGPALAAFDEADRVCRAVHGPGDVRLARIAMERAGALLRLGRAAEVVPIAEAALPVLAAHGQDERLSALYAIESAALSQLGERDRARTARELARAWQAYALGIGTGDRRIAANGGSG